MAEAWLPDELAHAGAEHLDAELVARYDRKQGAVDIGDDLAELAAHGIARHATIVDLGCGTGRFAVAAAAVVGRVIAVDVSTPMLAAARDHAAAAGVHNIEFVRAGFLTYRHGGSAVDAVYTRNALHHLPDAWKAVALERIAGLLRSGGVLRLRDLIYDFQPADLANHVEAWLAGAATDPSRGYTRDDLVEHIRTEHSTFRWLLEPMLAAAGLRIERAQFRAKVYGAYTCTKG